MNEWVTVSVYSRTTFFPGSIGTKHLMRMMNRCMCMYVCKCTINEELNYSLTVKMFMRKGVSVGRFRTNRLKWPINKQEVCKHFFVLLDAIRVNKYWPDKYSFLIDAWETTLSLPLSYTIVGKWQHAHQIRKPVKQQPSRRKVKPLGLRRMHSPFAGNLASHSNFMVAPLRYSPFHFVLLFQIHSHCESKHAVYNTHYTYIHTPNDHERRLWRWRPSPTATGKQIRTVAPTII